MNTFHGTPSNPCHCTCAPEDGCFSTRQFPSGGPFHYEACPEYDAKAIGRRLGVR